MPLLAELMELSDDPTSTNVLSLRDFELLGFRKQNLFSLNIPFHACKLLMGKGMSERRWRVQIAGSVAT